MSEQRIHAESEHVEWANRCIEGPVGHAKDVLGMPARVGDRGILTRLRAFKAHALWRTN